MIYGWGDTNRKILPLGYTRCKVCGAFKPLYLSKLVFRIHISYIPIFMKRKGYTIHCGNCMRYSEISQEQFAQLKEIYSSFKSKKLVKACYKDALSLCSGLEPDESNINYVLSKLKETYPISEGEMSNHYSDLIKDILIYKPEK